MRVQFPYFCKTSKYFSLNLDRRMYLINIIFVIILNLAAHMEKLPYPQWLKLYTADQEPSFTNPKQLYPGLSHRVRLGSRCAIFTISPLQSLATVCVAHDIWDLSKGRRLESSPVAQVANRRGASAVCRAQMKQQFGAWVRYTTWKKQSN